MYFVLVAVQQKKRRGDLVDCEKRRTSDEFVAFFGIRRNEPIVVMRLEFMGVFAEQLEIADAVM